MEFNDIKLIEKAARNFFENSGATVDQINIEFNFVNSTRLNLLIIVFFSLEDEKGEYNTNQTIRIYNLQEHRIERILASIALTEVDKSRI